MRIVTKKKLREECWNLDYELIEWLNEHLKIYKEDAGRVVDLEFKKYKHKKKEYTQLEIINKLIEITNSLLNDEPYSDNLYTELISVKEVQKICAKKDEMYDLLKLVHWDLWW